VGHRGRIGIALLAALALAGGVAWQVSDDEATSVRTGGTSSELAGDPSGDGDPQAATTTDPTGATDPTPSRSSTTPGDDRFVPADQPPSTTATGPAPDGTTTTGPDDTTSTTGGPTTPTSLPSPSTTGPTGVSTTTTTSPDDPPPTTTTTGPRPDPDGRTLVYSREVGPQEVRLFIGDVDGSYERPLTSGGNDQFPAWSPAGSAIVFTRFTRDGSSDLWTVRPDGTGLRQLTNGGAKDKRDAVWSPNGLFLAFTGAYKVPAPSVWDTRIVVLELATGVMSDVSTGPLDTVPAWSPDSATLAYRTPSPSHQDYELALVDRDGTNRRPLISAPEDDRGQDYFPYGWSEDGRRILAYEVNAADDGHGHIITIHPDGTGRQEILSDGQPFPGGSGTGSLQFLSWSPDERSIVYHTAEGLGFVNTDGTGHRLLDQPSKQRWQADWSPV
jgi:Tol biopolymer transport system component